MGNKKRLLPLFLLILFTPLWVGATPPQKGSRASRLGQADRDLLEGRYLASFDAKFGGWNGPTKRLDADKIEYSLARTIAGDQRHRQILETTLAAVASLVDPVWGGVYESARKRDFSKINFEKQLITQAAAIRVFVHAYSFLETPEHLTTANEIYFYVKRFLKSPHGVFYSAQEGTPPGGTSAQEYFGWTDPLRQKAGIPEVSTTILTRENAEMARALATLYGISGKPELLEEAQEILNWLEFHRKATQGGFARKGEENEVASLADTVAVGSAELELYQVTADRSWLGKASKVALWSAQHWRSDKPDFSIWVQLGRFANRLHHYSGEEEHSSLADSVLKRAVQAKSSSKQKHAAQLLLADLERASEPIHVTVVGEKHDPQAKALFRSALRYPSVHKRIEWWDRKEGPLPNADVQYPQLGRAAAFACNEKTCSLPVFEPNLIEIAINRLLGKKKF